MSTRTLSSPPRTLPLYARATAPLLPGASLLPFVGGRGGELPEIELVLEQVSVNRDRLAAYAHVCGSTLRDALPATFPHVLAFPLHLALMTDPKFPFGAIGLVHLSNRIVQRRPIDISEKLDLRVRTTPLSPHRRGQTFSIVSEARVEGELVWEDHSTMLRRGSSGNDAPSEQPAPESAGQADPADERQAPPQSAVWRLPGDLGRRYASVSGDRNPIHMHGLSAKLFGFPRAIAHGMWTKAHCLAALEQLLPDAFAVEVTFRKPILLPGEVGFGMTEEADGAIDFAVQGTKSATRHLDGRVERHAQKER